MIERQEGKTVYAVASGKGVAGVSIVRISGMNCKDVLQKLVGFVPEPRQANLRKIHCLNSKDTIDSGLVLWFPAPASYTGEDVVELHVHGGAAVIRLLLGELSKIDNFAPAQPGEFTRRAFANGKMDLTEIEGLADLIHAETEYQRQHALKHYQGFGSKQYEKWRGELKRCLAHLEASIDFSEEELEDNLEAQINLKIASLIEEMERCVNAAVYGERLRNGFKIVLAGDVNVGKSTLLNALTRRDVAIVSDTPGTTRDVLEVHLDLQGMPVIISDTAGLRDTAGEIEKEGIRRARDKIKCADLVIWMDDGFSSETNLKLASIISEEKTIRVRNKCDLGDISKQESVIRISAKTGQGLDELLARISKKAQSGLEKGIESIVTRERHKMALEACIVALKEAQQFSKSELDLKTETLRISMNELGVIIGTVGVEEILDTIFLEFCIGK